MTLYDILQGNGNVVYSNVITGLTVVHHDGERLFRVYRNFGTVNDGRFVFVCSFTDSARDVLHASDIAIAFVNSRAMRVHHSPVVGSPFANIV